MSPWGNRRKDGRITSLNTYYNSFLVSLCPSESRQARAWKHLLPSTPFFFLPPLLWWSQSLLTLSPDPKKALLLLLDLMLVCCLRKARDRMEGIRYLPNEVETGWNNPLIKAHNCSTLLYSNTLQSNSGSVDLCLIPPNQSKEGPSSVQVGLHQVSTRSCIQK